MEHWSRRRALAQIHPVSFIHNINQVITRSQNPLLGRHRSWQRIQIGEISKITNGYAFKSAYFNQSKGHPLIRIRDVLKGHTGTFYDGPVPAGYWVDPGELIVGMDGDFNSRIWTGQKGLLNQRVCKISPDENFLSLRFLAFALPGYLKAINDHTSSLTVKHLSSRTIAEIPIALPPRAEQDRIVAALDVLFSRLDAAEGGLKKAKILLKRYRQSVVRAAFSGALTKEWREGHASLAESAEMTLRDMRTALLDASEGRRRRSDHIRTSDKDLNWRPPLSCPKSWAWSTLGEIAEVVGGLTKDAKRKVENAVEAPYLRVANVQRGYLDLSEIKTIRATPAEITELSLRPGDILLNEGGDLDKLGRGWVWEGQIDGCVHQNHVFRARVHAFRIPAAFLSRYINEFCQPFFMSHGSQTTNLASVSMSKVRRVPIPIPPREEMIEIDRRCTELLDRIDELDTRVEERLETAASARQSILITAFRGELVPQDTHDESAEKLVERIRAGRQARSNMQKRRRQKAIELTV